MESRPRLVILGRADEPPPGVEEAEPLARLDYATTTDDLVAAIDGAPAVFAWDYEPDLLPSAWDRAGGVRWIQAVPFHSHVSLYMADSYAPNPPKSIVALLASSYAIS